MILQSETTNITKKALALLIQQFSSVWLPVSQIKELEAQKSWYKIYFVFVRYFFFYTAPTHHFL